MSAAFQLAQSRIETSLTRTTQFDCARNFLEIYRMGKRIRKKSRKHSAGPPATAGMLPHPLPENEELYELSSAGVPAATASLYVISTPIGNLGDFSPRAIEVLTKVGLVLCEDTRAFARLAQHFGVQTDYRSFHEHNELFQCERAIEVLASGKDLALVSEAGTPLISDPGYRIVRACKLRGYAVRSVPGPSAVMAALSTSGLPCERFVFEGFLPTKSGRRSSVITDILGRDMPTVCFESPHRIEATLELLCELAPGREIFVGRELTKLFEEGLLGYPAQILQTFRSRDGNIKGEFVLIVGKLPKLGRELDEDTADEPTENIG